MPTLNSNGIGSSENLKVAIIGGGWFGCQTAIELKSIYSDKENCHNRYKNIEVFIFEKNEDIFMGLSGDFGIRLHAGPHYPRSKCTREGSQIGFHEFLETYPQLTIQHLYSHYALGIKDSDQNPPKVSKEHFEQVCQEFAYINEVNIAKHGYEQLQYAANLEEPSTVVGPKLRDYFNQHLKELGIVLIKNFKITSITHDEQNLGKFHLHSDQKNSVPIKEQEILQNFTHVINATGFMDHIPENLDSLMKAKVVFNISGGLVYKLKKFNNIDQPISFIVMDGSFPCLMPYDDREIEEIYKPIQKYIVIHGKYTNIDGYATMDEALNALKNLSHDTIKDVESNSANEMVKFWPAFQKHFEFIEWKGAIIPKLDCKNAFRNALAFRDDSKNGLIHIFPGKINNIFEIGREVKMLMDLGPTGQDSKQKNGGTILKMGQHFSFVENGLFHRSLKEIGFD